MKPIYIYKGKRNITQSTMNRVFKSIRKQRINTRLFRSQTINFTTKKELNLPDTKPLLSQFTLRGLESTSDQNVIKGASSTTFVVGNYTIPGPVMILNNAIFLWDVPQFGVGSKQVEIETPLNSTPGKEVVSDTDSVFYGWTTDMFKLLEFLDPAPGTYIISAKVL